jgi:hypothetical protein
VAGLAGRYRRRAEPVPALVRRAHDDCRRLHLRAAIDQHEGLRRHAGQAGIGQRLLQQADVAQPRGRRHLDAAIDLAREARAPGGQRLVGGDGRDWRLRPRAATGQQPDAGQQGQAEQAATQRRV